jgi:hypothetical protein
VLGLLSRGLRGWVLLQEAEDEDKSDVEYLKGSVYRNCFCEFDDRNFLWLDLDAQFWAEDRLSDKPKDRDMLEGFLQEVALKVGNMLLMAVKKDPIGRKSRPEEEEEEEGSASASMTYFEDALDDYSDLDNWKKAETKQVWAWA